MALTKVQAIKEMFPNVTMDELKKFSPEERSKFAEDVKDQMIKNGTHKPTDFDF